MSKFVGKAAAMGISAAVAAFSFFTVPAGSPCALLLPFLPGDANCCLQGRRCGSGYRAARQAV